MKYTVISWNCNGDFRLKFPALLKAYPDADIFVIRQCEDPYFYDNEPFKRLFSNGFRIPAAQNPAALLAREGITLRRLRPAADACGNAPVTALIDNAFVLRINCPGNTLPDIPADIPAANPDMPTLTLSPSVAASPEGIVTTETPPEDDRSSWLKSSTHVPVKIVLDTDAQPLPEIPDDALYAPTRIIRPKSELKQEQQKTPTRRLSITMPNGRLICRDKATDTFRDFIMGMGWEDVRYLNFDVRGKDLITQDHPTGWHKQLVPGWYVNTNMPPRVMKITAYEIARALGRKISVTFT